MALPQPRTSAGSSALDALLAAPGGALLAVDFDGTLAPIVARPQDARPLAGATRTLATLARWLKTVAIITGRPAGQVLELGGFTSVDGLAGLVVLGAYGRETWDARSGRVVAPPVPAGVDDVRRKLPEMLRESDPGITIEDKGSSLVVHTRRAAEPAVSLGRLQGPLAALAERHGLVVEQARLALELRPPGFDKGSALMKLAFDQQARVVVFVGDDLGDLPAYDAVDALVARGVHGLKVCSDSAEVSPEMLDRADLVLPGPEGVLVFLTALATSLSAGAASG